MPGLGLRLTPHGRLVVEDQDDAPEVDAKALTRLTAAFAQGTGNGLVRLGAGEVGQALPPVFVWWRAFAARYVASLCLHASGTEGNRAPKLPIVPVPTAAELASLVLTAPMMAGAEYLTADVLSALWDEMAQAFAAALAAAGTGLQSFLTALNPAWNLVGRVHFNLAENRRDPDQPFAFMATYTTRLSAGAKAQHVPLGQALREYAGAAHRDKLLSLLLPVQRAAQHCAWLKPMIDAGDIFHPLRWGPGEAARLLHSLPDLETAGVVVRMPVSWRANRPARPQVTATIGTRAPSAVGLDGLLDFRMEVMLDDGPLTEAEVATLLAGTENLVLLRGQWVEVDRARLERTMEQFRAAEKLAARDGLSFAEAMRMLAGAAVTRDDPAAADADWARVTAGPWLEQTLKDLRAPDGQGVDPGPALHGTLRPYQRAGTQWLHLALRPWPRCLPGRRHGPRQDDPGVVLAAGGAGARRKSPAEPAGGAGLAAGQLGGGDREIRPRPEGGDRASLGDASRSGEGVHGRTGGGVRSGDHQLWLAAAYPGVRRDRLAICHSGRGASDQKPERAPDQGGKGAESQGADRDDRDAGGKPPGRPVVDLRFHQPGPVGQRQTIHPLHQRPGRADAQSVRPAARTGAALHPAPDENRQVDHRRPA